MRIPDKNAMSHILSTYPVVQLGFQRTYTEEDVHQMKGTAGPFLNVVYSLVQRIKQSKGVSDGKHRIIDQEHSAMDTCKTSEETDTTDDGMRFKHYRVAFKESRTNFRIYESNGDFDNISKGKEISTYQHKDYDIEHLLSYDFECGVYACVYPNMNTKAKGARQRAETCHQLLDDPYYSFASLNCENVANYIMSGRGYSKQLVEMDTSMWVFSDIMDLYISFYKDIILLSLCLCILGIDFSLLAECIFVLGLWQRENRHLNLQMKEEKYSARQIFKYAGSFLIRSSLVNLSSGSIEAQVLASLSFMWLAPCLGYLHDHFNLGAVTTKVFNYVRTLLK